jgi:hypothetical protein
MEPNDVDCALLLSADYPRDKAAADELANGLPFLDILQVDLEGFDRLVHGFFVTDRRGVIKGMVEILL